jgi:DNA invertase Pin-like site-specific DNA recombinase
MDPKTNSSEPRIVRCAIYARKSTEEGLAQPFNSLDAQRESAEAYISSQRHRGWTALERRYDDGGYTGANLERPALRALMEDIESGQVDCVVVYKVDRLSRSLLDFARLIGVFEEHGVSLVSVTQQMNTTDSLGRLTLNILLSFAQFERELIAERTRDKMRAARRKGKWCGPAGRWPEGQHRRGGASALHLSEYCGSAKRRGSGPPTSPAGLDHQDLDQQVRQATSGPPISGIGCNSAGEECDLFGETTRWRADLPSGTHGHGGLRSLGTGERSRCGRAT